jgi:cytochrome P450
MITDVIKSNSNESANEMREALGNYDTSRVHKILKKWASPELSHIPGTKGLPVVGHAVYMLINLHRWMNQQQKEYGNIFKLNIPVNYGHGVMMLGPEANKLVFLNEGQKFSNFIAWETAFKNLFDNAVLQRDFADHKALRKVLQSAFKREAIEGHMELMNPMLEKGLKEWPNGRSIRSMDYVKELLLSTGSNVFLGVEPGKETQKINQAFTDIVAATADVFKIDAVWFSPYAKGVRARKFLSKFIIERIPERRSKLSRDLFSQFCHLKHEDGTYFTDEEIRDQILFVLFAAHDTTTSALSAVLYALASNQEWQEELRQEILDLDKGTVEFEDLEKLYKTDLTIKEALRMYPALAMMPRFALEEVEFEGYKIPANTPVVISSVYTHYMEEYWTDPYTFDPMRFSPERAEDKKHPYQYIPFGGGAHKCLGLHFAQVQSKIFLFHLLKNYRVTKDPKITEYKYNNLPLTFPTDGLPLTFSKV